MTDHIRDPRPDLTRRVVLRSAALSGVSLPLLAACGSDEPAGNAGGGSNGGNGGGETGGGGNGGGETGSGAGGGTTVPTSDVPVGGGTILGEEQTVVTQPSEGEFKAFSAICTHQGCTVANVADQQINCECHGSAFSIEDGSVVNGPATSPLGTKKLTVEGDQIVLG